MFQSQRIIEDLKNNIFRMDKMILSIVYALVTISTIFVYSATRQNGMVVKNILWIVIGTILMFIIASFDYKHIKLYIWHIYGIGAVLLLLVRFAGKKTLGAQRWIALGPFQLQPSEFVKLGMIICLATVIEKNSAKLNEPKTLIKVLIFAFIPVGLVLMQPDFGTAFVFILVIGSMLFVAGISLRLVVYTLLAAVASLPAFYFSLSPYQKNRILNFLHPERDITNTGYQAVQGKIAAGSGKFIGRGLFKGPQNQFNFIPEKQTDYIFPVFVEEMGFVGGTILIGLYTIMLYRFVKLSKKTANKFNQMLIIGICAMFLAHIFENIGMTIGLMPITGIPLPFLSYGGTFQLVNLIAMGIVLSISCEKTPLDFM